MSIPEKDSAIDAQRTDWTEIVRRLGSRFAQRAIEHDTDGSFVAENYEVLKEHRFFSAGVPRELGGGGASHAELCGLLQELGHHCSSTALALSMHQHLVAAMVWKWRRSQEGEEMLRRLASEETVLVSTGATDWLDSNGHVQRERGGFRVTARKVFASGCPAGQLLITSAPYDDPRDGSTVLHFAVPFGAEGVRILDDWNTLGMRGTGSHTVLLEGVFVPDAAITLRRPRGKWHPIWSVILTVALPLIMSPYLGIAEAAAAIARRRGTKKIGDPHLPYLVGEMENALATAQVAVRDMISNVADYDFEPDIEHANAALIRKTIVARAAIQTVQKAMEVTGAAGYYRSFSLERLFRDVHGAPYHPLAEKKQLLFTGRVSLGLDPAG